MECKVLYLSLLYNLLIVFIHFCTSLQLQVFDSRHSLNQKKGKEEKEKKMNEKKEYKAQLGA